MDWTTIRLTAQVLLTSWAIAEIVMLAAAAYQCSGLLGNVGQPSALQFCCLDVPFVASIQNTALFPRSDIVGVFAILELSAAICAWDGSCKTHGQISVPCQEE